MDWLTRDWLGHALADYAHVTLLDTLHTHPPRHIQACRHDTTPRGTIPRQPVIRAHLQGV